APLEAARDPDGLDADVALVVERLGDDLDDSFLEGDDDGFAAFAAADESEPEVIPEPAAAAEAPPAAVPSLEPETAAPGLPAIDVTPKRCGGGRQVRRDSGYSYAIASRSGKFLGEVGLGNRRDIRNAVEAARKASGWSTTPAHNR